jgi:hypothetical protein
LREQLVGASFGSEALIEPRPGGRQWIRDRRRLVALAGRRVAALSFDAGEDQTLRNAEDCHARALREQARCD